MNWWESDPVVPGGTAVATPPAGNWWENDPVAPPETPRPTQEEVDRAYFEERLRLSQEEAAKRAANPNVPVDLPPVPQPPAPPAPVVDPTDFSRFQPPVDAMRAQQGEAQQPLQQPAPVDPNEEKLKYYKAFLDQQLAGGEIDQERYSAELADATMRYQDPGKLIAQQMAAERQAREAYRAEGNRTARTAEYIGKHSIPFASSLFNSANKIDVINAAKRIEGGYYMPRDLEVMSKFMVDAEEASQAGFGSKVVDLLADMPAFIGELAVTGGAFKAGQAGTKAAVEGALSKTLGAKAAGYAATAAGGLAGTAALTAINPQQIAGSTLERMLPTTESITDKDGQTVSVNLGPGKSFLEALPAGAVDSMIELGTEMAGTKLTEAAAAALKPAGKVLSRLPYADRIAALRKGIVSRWLGLPGNNAAKLQAKLADVGWNGVIGEALEERAGDVARMATRLQSPYDNPTGQLLIAAPYEAVAGDPQKARDLQNQAFYQLAVEGAGFGAVGLLGMAAERTATGGDHQQTEQQAPPTEPPAAPPAEPPVTGKAAQTAKAEKRLADKLALGQAVSRKDLESVGIPSGGTNVQKRTEIGWQYFADKDKQKPAEEAATEVATPTTAATEPVTEPPAATPVGDTRQETGLANQWQPVPAGVQVPNHPSIETRVDDQGNTFVRKAPPVVEQSIIDHGPLEQMTRSQLDQQAADLGIKKSRLKSRDKVIELITAQEERIRQGNALPPSTGKEVQNVKEQEQAGQGSQQEAQGQQQEVLRQEEGLLEKPSQAETVAQLPATTTVPTESPVAAPVEQSKVYHSFSHDGRQYKQEFVGNELRPTGQRGVGVSTFVEKGFHGSIPVVTQRVLDQTNRHMDIAEYKLYEGNAEGKPVTPDAKQTPLSRINTPLEELDALTAESLKSKDPSVQRRAEVTQKWLADPKNRERYQQIVAKNAPATGAITPTATPAPAPAPKKINPKKPVSIQTQSGRTISGPPQIRTDTNRKATADYKKQHQWLLDQGIAEAESRGDDYNLTWMRNEKVGNHGLPPATADSLNEYLFGETNPEWNATTGERIATGQELSKQPPVVPKITKPLVEKPAAPKQPAKTETPEQEDVRYMRDNHGIDNFQIVEPENQDHHDALDFLNSVGAKGVKFFRAPGTRVAGFTNTKTGTVYLNADIQGKTLQHAIGDEAAHATGLDKRSEADETVISEYEQKRLAKASPKYRAYLESHPDMLRREAIAEMFGDFYTDPEFRESLKKNNRSLHEWLRDILRKVLGKWTPKDAARRKAYDEFRREMDASEAKPEKKINPKKAAAPEAKPAESLDSFDPAELEADVLAHLQGKAPKSKTATLIIKPIYGGPETRLEVPDTTPKKINPTPKKPVTPQIQQSAAEMATSKPPVSDAFKDAAKAFADIVKSKPGNDILLSEEEPAEREHPELMAAAAKMAVAYVKAGGRSYGEFARLVSDTAGRDVALRAENYVRGSWDYLRERFPDAKMDSSAPLTEVLGDSDEHSEDLSGSPETTAPETVPSPDGSGNSGRGGRSGRSKLPKGKTGVSESGNDDAGSDLGSDNGLVDSNLGEGGGVAGQPDEAGGVGGRGSASGSDGSGDAGLSSDQEGEAGVLPGRRPKGGKKGESQDGIPAQNTRLDPAAIGQGGAKTKYKDNVAAIKLLRKIQLEGRTHATREEQATLAKYVGWGMFPGVFNDTAEDVGQWTAERNEIKGLLDEEEWRAAHASTVNAHYTSPQIVQGMWDIARKLGFRGGRVIETSAGVGNFIGLQPADMAGSSRWTAIELDKVTGSILKLLYPESRVEIEGYQQFEVPDNFYDLAISNVPFDSTTRILSDKRYKKFRPALHDYFFLKTIDKVRPGGMVAFITSTGTMDKADDKVRKYISGKADLVAAFRLPEDTFGKNAGTAVVTDLIILQRRPDGQPASDTSWAGIGTVSDPAGGDDIPINEYYVKHPEQVLGIVDRKSRMYAKNQPHVSSTPDFEDRWNKALERLPENIHQLAAQSVLAHADPMLLDADEVPGQLVYRDGKIYTVGRAEVSEITPPEPHPTSKATTTRRKNAYERQVKAVRDYQPMRAAAKKVIAVQLSGQPLEDREAARKEYSKEYDKFVKKHGPVSSSIVRKSLSDDIDYDLVASTENWDEETGEATKGDFFKKDTIRPMETAGKAGSIEQAIGLSLNKHGRLDVASMADMIGAKVEDVEKQLTTSNLGYNDPSNGWTVKDEYLSGNVRAKLADAIAAAKDDPAFERNVEALTKVIPEDRTYDRITIYPNSGWLPLDVFPQFAAKLFNATPGDFDLRHIEATGDFYFDYSPSGQSKFVGSPLSNEVWGTRWADFTEIVGSLLSQVPIRITYRDADGNTVFDAEGTEASNDKVQELGEEFLDWVWADPERRERLVRIYNDKHNSYVKREYDGSHMQFPGMAPPGTQMGSFVFEGLRQHQKNAVWQVVVRRRGLLAHEVGTGKTMTMVAAAMETRRLGIFHKPTIVVPDSRVEATAREALQLYPAARILTAARGMDPSKRRQTAARIASGDWDLVILTHENLKAMPVSRELREQYIRGQLAELEEMLRAEGVTDVNDERQIKSIARGNVVVKKLARMLTAARERLQSATDLSKDTGVKFEETGIDFLMVDEAHEFKSLPIMSRLGRVKGIPANEAEKAINLQMISSYVQAQNGGGGLVMATGTPITNSLAELYVMQRFIQGKELESIGLLPFDSWQATFGQIETKLEFDHAGGVSNQSRFASFVNLRDLRQIVSQDMDVLRVSDNQSLAEQLNRPTREDYQETIPTSDAQAEYMAQIAARARALKGKRPERGGDNHLRIATDGTKAAMDLRLVRGGEEEADSKAKRLVHNLLNIRKEVPDGTQMIFFDKGRSTDTGFDIGEDIKDKLAAAGIPRDKILDFRGVDSKRKDGMIERLKSGDAWFAMGNKKTLGTGVNAQDYVSAIHFLEPAWTPEALEQCIGRGWRQGNRNSSGKLKVITYLSAGTLDSWRWGVVAKKAKGIEQFMVGDMDSDTLEEEDAEDFSYLGYERMQALSSGNPLRIELINIDNDISKLARAQERFNRQKVRSRSEIEYAERRIREYESTIIKGQEDDKQSYDAAVEAKEPLFKDFRGREYTERKDVARAIKEAFQQRVVASTYSSMSTGWKPLGMYRGGFQVMGKRVSFTTSRGIRYAAEIMLRRKDEYSASGKSLYDDAEEFITEGDPIGVVQSIEYNLSHIDKVIENSKQDVTKYKHGTDALKKDLAKPWRDREKFAKKQQLAQRLRDAIAAGKTKLDPERKAERRDRQEEFRTFGESLLYRDVNEPKPKKINPKKPGSAAEQAQRDADSGEEIVHPGFGLGAIAEKVRQKTVHASIQADNPAVEERLVAAHGIEGPSLAQRIKDGAAKAWHVATRVREHLPNTRRFDSAREILRLMDAAPSAAADEATRTIAAIMDPLDSDGREIFERKILADNLRASVERGQPLRFGFNSLDEIIDYQGKVDEAVEKNPQIQQALDTRRKIIKEQVDELVKHGILNEEAKENAETYFHQQVLSYVQAGRSSGSKPQRQKRGFQKRRVTGPEELEKLYDYNTNYLEAEAEWMTDAESELRKEKLLKKLGDAYDRHDEFKDKAKSQNYIAVVGGPKVASRIAQIKGEIAESLNSEDSGDSGERARRKALIEEREKIDPTYPFDRQIAKMSSWLRSLVEEGEAPLGPFRRGQVLSDTEDDEDEPGGKFMEYVNWLANEEHGKATAAALSIFKAIDAKRQFIKDTLGDRFVTVESQVKDDPSLGLWQPTPGNVFYRAFTIPEKVAEELLQGITETAGISKDQIRQAIAMGGPRKPMVLPVELADQLEAMQKPRPTGWISSTARGAMGAWKWWTILNPKRAVGYMVRNLTGDIDPLLAARPSALKYTNQAISELKDYYTGRLAMSPELRMARDMGVMSGSLTAQEIPDLKHLPVFRRVYASTVPVAKLPAEALNGIKQFNEFRESILRYAAFLDYLQELKAGTLKDYGASHPETIDILQKALGSEVAAANLARNLLGDYGNITVAGQFIRSYMIPFYSWMEVNTKRWPRLASNAVKSGRMKNKDNLAAAGGAALIGLLKLGTLTALMAAWNRLFFPDDDDKLGPNERGNPHLVFGHRDDGTVRILRNTGALGDFLEWFGAGTLVSLWPQYEAGQISAQDMLQEMAKDPLNKVVQGLAPQIKALPELVSGQSLFPDATNPRSQPRDEALAANLSVRDEYKALKGMLTGSGERSRPHNAESYLGIGTVDPKRETISEIMSLRERFLENKGKPSVNVLRTSDFSPMREAAYAGDYEAFKKSRDAYRLKGKGLENFIDSTTHLDPIHARLNDKDEKEFEQKFLNGVQRQRLAAARDYASELRSTMLSWWWKAAKESGDRKQIAEATEYKRKRVVGLKKVLNREIKPGPGFKERFLEAGDLKKSAREELKRLGPL